MAILQEDLFVALSLAARAPNLACLSGSCQVPRLSSDVSGRRDSARVHAWQRCLPPLASCTTNVCLLVQHSAPTHMAVK